MIWRRPADRRIQRGLALALFGLAACRARSSDEPSARRVAPVSARTAERAAPRASGCPGERTAAPAAEAGHATYYDLTGPGSCSFDRPRESPDRMVAAVSGADYAHAAWCGACLAVAGPLGDVVVRVVDQCPGCRHGDLDLSREAFAQIAPLSAGRTKVTWHEVPCPVTGPVVYQVKPGSTASWTAIQLRNHRHRIARLEARDAHGVYHAIARTDDNYFVVPGGLGPGPYALRVSDVHGHALEDGAIALGPAAQPGVAQFPSCR